MRFNRVRTSGNAMFNHKSIVSAMTNLALEI